MVSPGPPVIGLKEAMEGGRSKAVRKTETVLAFWFTTAKSGILSPVKSTITLAKGAVPVAKSTLVAKLMFPLVLLFLKIEAVDGVVVEVALLETATSTLPSPSRSPTAMRIGVVPVVKSTFAANLTVSTLLVLRNMVNFTPWSTTRASSFPSPSISPKVVPKGKLPASKSALATNDMVPLVLLLRRTEIVPP